MPGKKIKIAIIDDDEDDFLLISDFIKDIDVNRFTIDWFKDYNAAFPHIRNRTYDLYFVDYFLGEMTGLDVLKEAAAMKLDRPVVLLTGVGNKDIDIRAMECGATDYLVKSELNTEKLERCIRYSMERTSFLEELKAREIKYRDLFEGSKDAVFIADTDLAFIEVNHSGRLLLETKNGTLSGRNLYDFIEDKIQKARIRDLVKTSGKIDDLEIKLNNDSKDIKTCLLSLHVSHTDESTPVVHGIIHDITNIRKAELANLQAEKLEANERLIRILAHEIRNPLNNIILSVEHLLPVNEDNGQRDLLNIISRNSIRINKIISELLGLANPEEMVFENYPLQDIMEESLSMASDRIKLNKINLEKIYPPSMLRVPANKNKLVIAFTNIIINAIEAMETDQGKLSIQLDDAGERYTISIKDNGKGIPGEYLSKLFEPFFTLKKNGTGLGLAASYSIFQSHKASIDVKSTVGEGTNFLISFNKSLCN